MYNEDGDLDEDWLEAFMLEKYQDEFEARQNYPGGSEKYTEEYRKGFANGYLFRTLAPNLSFYIGKDENTPYADGFREGFLEKNDDKLHGRCSIKNWLEVARLILIENKNEDALRDFEAIEKESLVSTTGHNYGAGFNRGSFISKYIPEHVDEIIKLSLDRRDDFGCGFRDGLKENQKEKPKGLFLEMTDKYLPSWLRLNSPQKNSPNVAKDKDIDCEIWSDF